MNALRQETTAFEAMEDLLARFGALDLLRALVAHRLRRRRARASLNVDALPTFLQRDLGLHEPRVMWQDPGSYR